MKVQSTTFDDDVDMEIQKTKETSSSNVSLETEV